MDFLCLQSPGIPTRINSYYQAFQCAFEQTYRRYLDLVRAESQAREAEIELALERVRARTMAMQHSDELTEASEVLDRQVRELYRNLGLCFSYLCR